MNIDLQAGVDVVDLSHSMTDDMPNFPSAPAFSRVPYYRLGDFELPGGYSGSNELVAMSGHSGTHLDALGHVAQNGAVFGGATMAEAQDGIRGLVRNSVDEVAPILGRGVFLDIARLLGVECLDGGTAVGPELLERAAGEAGVEITVGDSVLVRTGWQRHWTSPSQYLGDFDGAPGIDLASAHWLGDRGVRVIGSDTGTVEVTRPGSFELPVHMETLVQRGIHLLENMALDALAQRQAPEFMFVCSPLKIRGASGSPVRPIAVIPA